MLREQYGAMTHLENMIENRHRVRSKVSFKRELLKTLSMTVNALCAFF